MKKTELISDGKNYTAVSVGKMDALRDFQLALGPDIMIPGKVFAGSALKATGAELSFQTFLPGEGSAFVHTHKKHEELYFVLQGKGEFQVDGESFPVSEGGIVRIAPDGRRALRNVGETSLVVLCIQYEAGSFGEADTPAADGIVLEGGVNW